MKNNSQSILLRFLLAAAMCFPFLARAGLLGPSNYWECVLDLMPGTQNDIVARNIIMQCGNKFPDRSPIERKDKIGGLFSVPKADDCLTKYGKNTPSNLAARMIYGACHQLYWD